MSASHPTGTAPSDLSAKRVSVVTSLGRAAFPEGLRSCGSLEGISQSCPRQVASPDPESSYFSAVSHTNPNREDLRTHAPTDYRFATETADSVRSRIEGECGPPSHPAEPPRPLGA